MYFDHGLSINGYYMKYKLHYENRGLILKEKRKLNKVEKENKPQ